MTPSRPWSSIAIDPTAWPEICAAVEAHAGENDACRLGSYWRERMSPTMARAIAGNGHLPYGFVGDGWPIRTDQAHVLRRDALGLSMFYHPDDLHTRDAGDAVEQGNWLIEEALARVPVGRIVVADVGAGYGRLAVPFIGHLKERLVYLGIDYSPIGLLVAPQFIAQATHAADVFGFPTFEEHPFTVAEIPYTHTEGTPWFYSLPAWRLDRVRPRSVHVVAAIHSFQEMELRTVRWYLRWIEAVAAPGAIVYSVNGDDEAWLGDVPKSWACVCDDMPVANRDGNYRARLWATS